MTEIEWKGHLADDCSAIWRNMVAHAEAISHNQWYCTVRIDGEDEPLFHSMEDDIHPVTGEAARKLCEMVMRLQKVEK